MNLDTVVIGVFMTALSAVVAGGIVATVVKIPATMAFTALFRPATSSRDRWSVTSGGGIVAVVMSRRPQHPHADR